MSVGLGISTNSHALDPTTAVERTLRSSPELALYPYYVRASDAEALQAGLKPNPRLELDIENVFGSGESRFLSGHELTLSLSQMLETGDKRERRVDLGDRKTASIQRDYEVKRLDVVAATLRDYYQLLRIQALLKWNQQRIASEHAAVKVIKRRAQAGVVGQADVMRMQLRLKKSETQQQLLLAEHEQARHTLASHWAALPEFEQVEGDLSALPPLPAKETFTEAIKQSPDYLLAMAETRIEQSRLALAKANSIADVTVGAGIRRSELSNDSSLVFNFSMPLQWHNQNQGNRAKAQAQIDAKMAAENLLETQLTVALKSIHSAMLNTLQQTQYLQNELQPVAQELLQEVERGYQSGLYNVLQWVDAQNELFAIERELIESRYSAQLQFLELERLSGVSLNNMNQVQTGNKE
jgi:cobalt-zinc-cadmium efflux system outer membrane protein